MWPFNKRKLKTFTLDNKYKIVEAFKLNGKRYWQFQSAMEMPAGRGLSAMVIFEEFKAKADKEYLDKHVRATEILLNPVPGKAIQLSKLAEINSNLKERINLVMLPDHCYKLASVHFWDDTESPYYYDPEYNKQKIEEWKKDPEALGFFLREPLKAYLPFLDTSNGTVDTYSKVLQKIDDMHQSVVQGVLSSLESTTAISK